MKKKCLFLGLLIGTNLLTVYTSAKPTTCAYAADVNLTTVNETMQNALNDQQNNQSTFNAAYHQVASDAYLDVANDILISKNQLIAAIKVTIEMQNSYGNTAIVAALQDMLEQVENSSSDFESTYNAYIPSQIDESMDSIALQALQSTLASDILTVANTVTSLQTQMTKQVTQVEEYVNSHLEVFVAMKAYVPNVADGTTASIFYIDTENACYYVNAGSYSEVSTGDIYSITDKSGDCIGSIKIIKTAEWYSVGTLINSNGVAVNDLITSLKTKRTPPKNE